MLRSSIYLPRAERWFPWCDGLILRNETTVLRHRGIQRAHGCAFARSHWRCVGCDPVERLRPMSGTRQRSVADVRSISLQQNTKRSRSSKSIEVLRPDNSGKEPATPTKCEDRWSARRAPEETEISERRGYWGETASQFYILSTMSLVVCRCEFYSSGVLGGRRRLHHIRRRA